MSTKFDPKTATLTELVAEYNRIAEAIGETPVKKFKDKETGIKRLGVIRGMEAVHRASNATKSPKGKAKAEAPAPKADKKAKPTEKDLLGEDDDEPKPKKKAKADKKAKPTEKDLLGEDDDEPKPKKKAKAAAPEADKKPRGKNSLEKGKEPTFEHPAFSIQKEPRDGTFRAQILAMLESEKGTTIKQMENAFTKYWEKKGISPKVDLHLRALEMLRLLRYQNGFGFTEKDGRIFALRAPAKSK